MKVKMFHDNVLVERDKAVESISPGGLVLPSNDRTVPDTGTVVDVGPGRKLTNGETIVPCVKVGDRIVIGRFAGTTIKIGTVSYLIIPWNDILGFVED